MIQHNSPKKTAVGYVRVSSDDQVPMPPSRSRSLT